MESRSKPNGLALGAGTSTSDAGNGTPAVGSSGGNRPGDLTSGERLDEPSPEVILIMPFTISFCLALALRDWLRRRIGWRAGTGVGNTVIIVFGGPPLVIAGVLVLILRAAGRILERVETAVKARH